MSSLFMQGQEALPALFAGAKTASRARRVNRALVAELLAQGRSVADVAKTVGCTRQHVWRLMRKSPYLKRALAMAEGEVGAEADGRLAALRPAIVEAVIREIAGGNPRVLIWAANTLGVGRGRYAPPLREAEPLPPEVARELSRLRQQVEYYRSEIDRYERLLDADLPDPDEDTDDVA